MMGQARSRRSPGSGLVLALALWLSASAAADAADPSPATPTEPRALPAAKLVVEVPPVVVRGLPFELTARLDGPAPTDPAIVEVRAADGGAVLAEAPIAPGAAAELSVPAASPGTRFTVSLRGIPATDTTVTPRTIPGWSTLLPPVLAIALALALRQVIPALVAGIWAGSWLCFGGPLVGGLRMVDRYVVRALADHDHASIIVFSLLLGGMVGIVSRAGGTHGLVEALKPYATDSRRGQLVTWLLGILIFFDDYANTLLVGNTMRPVTDRLGISREKLAYIVDSTAAPVASVALVSTWIGYEVSLIGDALKRLDLDADAYGIFLRALPYNFYPFLALVFGLLIATTVREFGPMLTAERRARAGKVLADDAVPLSDFDTESLAPVPDRPRRWYNAVAPVLVVLLVTFGALWLTGRAALVAEGDPRGTASLFALGFEGLGGVFGAGDSFKALLWASFAGCLVALLLSRAQGILTLGDGLAAWVGGIKSMTLAIVILVLAWGIADVCTDLDTAGFMVALLSDHLDPRILPALVFVLAAVTSFATGTSWGTMGILLPLAVPTAFGVAGASHYDAAHTEAILLCSISAVLAGAIFGDHCSPISDTTVMSSMASGCDHVDHVRTQLPYAAIVGVVAVVAGYVPAGFDVPPLVCLALGSAVLVVALRWLGRPVAV